MIKYRWKEKRDIYKNSKYRAEIVYLANRSAFLLSGKLLYPLILIFSTFKLRQIIK